MPAISKIGPKLAFFGIVCGLFLVGWATRYSVAQNPAQDVPPPSIPAPDPSPPKTEAPKPAPLPAKTETIGADVAPQLPDPGPTDSLSVPSLNAAQDFAPAVSSKVAGAPAPVTVGPDHSPAEGDDPEKVANAFLEQNQKLAEAQLKALKDEAEKLRARLTKVEAGIKRWDRLLVALAQSQGTTEPQPAFTKVGTEVIETPGAREDLKLPPAARDEVGPDEAPPARAKPGKKVGKPSKPVAPADDRVPR
jgi:hypothetical protein